MPYQVVGVRFKTAGKIYFFDPGDYIINKGQDVIVETARGVEYGNVVVGITTVQDEEVVSPLKKVLRPASDQDRRQMALNKEREEEAFRVGLEKIQNHELPMKLVNVEQTFDGNKIIFYFTADGRIDFRELVKDLAAVFRTRIELRQIGVRDEAKMMGGLGCCGRELCCSLWLADFASVSIRMAKDQNLSLNPTKISGICGRLMCCLKYENEAYEHAKREHPDIGSRVTVSDGEGKVIGVNIFKRTLSVELRESKMVKEYPFEEVAAAKNTRSENNGPPGRNDKGNGEPGAGACCRAAEDKKACSCPGGRKH